MEYIVGLGLGRVRQGAKMLITPVACGCLIKQRRQPILAGNCRIGLRHWDEETIPLWNCAVDGPNKLCTQSAEVRLSVSGGQHLFTLGLLMIALSPVDVLSLLWSPSTNIEMFHFCQKYHLKDIHKIFKTFHTGLWFELGIWDKYWLNWEFLPFEVFFSCQCDVLLGIT